MGLLLDDYGHFAIDVIAILLILVALVTIGLIVTLKDKPKEKDLNAEDDDPKA